MHSLINLDDISVSQQFIALYFFYFLFMNVILFIFFSFFSLNFQFIFVFSCRFVFNDALLEQLSLPAITVSVFDHHVMHGNEGAQAVVDLPAGLSLTLVTSTVPRRLSKLSKSPCFGIQTSHLMMSWSWILLYPVRAAEMRRVLTGITQCSSSFVAMIAVPIATRSSDAG